MGKSDVGEGKITSVGCKVLWEVPYSHHHHFDLLAPTKEFMFQT